MKKSIILIQGKNEMHVYESCSYATHTYEHIREMNNENENRKKTRNIKHIIILCKARGK